MASIYSKRKVLYLGWYEELLTGKRVHRSISLKLKDTRENRKLANLIKKKKENILLFSNLKMQREITVSEAYPLFMETKKDKAANTIQYYKNSLRQLLHKYGDFHVRNIGRGEIKEIEKQLSGMSKESIISYKKGMKIFFSYLITEKFISENPIGKIEMIHNRKVVVMTDEELEEILYYFENRNNDHYNLIKFLVLSGFRISEAISLRWDDIKKDHIIVRNQKGKRKDYFPLTEAISKHLSIIKKEKETVFKYKQVSSTRNIGKHISKITEGKYSFHSFRKKFGTDWSRNLMPAELKEIMRHNDVRTTMEYYVGLNIIKIGEKMGEAKLKLKEKRNNKKCQIIQLENS